MRPLPWLVLFLLIAGAQYATGQGLVSMKPVNPVICYQSFHDRPGHVPVSERFRESKAARTAGVKTATFVVDYINFPADSLARKAFQYAIEIWESELVSEVPIRVTAEWKPLDAGVLAQALWGRAFANFGGEQHMNTFYPAALAEKIAGEPLNADTEADIVASFNSDASWYFGTDGNTPSGKMDLVTIVLHEIAHGLGFTDTYHVEATEGTFGLASGEASFPFIFDVFVESETGKNLVYDLQAPSAELKLALESQGLYFNSPLARAALAGERPELFAPSNFDAGSSISHLDETVFAGGGDANKLMTPHIDFAESIHDPGEVLRGVLGDMGWLYANILHTPLKDTERKDGQPYPVTVSIRSDNGYDATKVHLYYTTDGVNFSQVAMVPTGTADEFAASLPGTTDDAAYAYYISVVDGRGRQFTSPGKIQQAGKQPEQATHFFNAGADLAAPEIRHQPVTFILTSDPAIRFTADVTDNLGVREVVVEYAVNGGPLQSRLMTNEAGTDTYSLDVSFPAIIVGDEITYRLVALDRAAAGNTRAQPAEGFYRITVNGTVEPRDSYVNDFNAVSSDFFGTSFSIATPQGFADGAIHSDHPYSNGTGANQESHYVYQLQVPIRIDAANPVIRFDEIVLVEPGESGSSFGDAQFFDYVVVEGSADGGKSWEPFESGYDSRDDQRWLDHYNEGLAGDDSRSVGDSTLFRKQTIDMTAGDKFAPGDEVLIRFRLFADALAHGWGWAIDNLSIQGPVTTLEEPIALRLQIYPIPARETLFVEMHGPTDLPREIQILDAGGRVIFTSDLPGGSGHAPVSLDVSNLSPGLYFLRAPSGKHKLIRKFFKADR